jgi:ribonuclease HI
MLASLDLDIYTDGACKGNPGPMGLAWAIVGPDRALVSDGSVHAGQGTNQVAEILAAAKGLAAAPAGSTVTVLTDSEYVVRTMRGEYRRKANLTHWAKIDEGVARHARVSWQHVRGHKGVRWNEHVDSLASAAARLRDAKAPL